MEYELEEELKNIYNNKIKIDVKYLEPRKYLIETKINDNYQNFQYIYDAHLTFYANINIIEHIINTRIIIKYYLKGE